MRVLQVVTVPMARPVLPAQLVLLETLEALAQQELLGRPDPAAPEQLAPREKPEPQGPRERPASLEQA